MRRSNTCTWFTLHNPQGLTKIRSCLRAHLIKDDNRIENLELWCRPQPAGVRVSDLVDWATEVLRKYAPEKLR